MLKKNGISKYFAIILFTLIYLLILPITSISKELHVGNNYKFKTITSALTAAQNYDTVTLHNEHFIESNLIINKSITFKSNEGAIIDGEGKNQILKITADSVVVSGIKFINSGISFINDNAAIKLDSVRNCVIKNNIFENNFFGIYLARTSKSIITGNKLTAFNKKESYSGNGIHLWYCKDIKVIDNYVSGHRDGIYFEFVKESHINNNKSEGNLRYGLHFMFSDNCSYSQNKFINNGAGVAVMYTKNVKMFGNEFVNNWGAASYGILLKDISDSEIKNNYFIKNSSGIYIEGSNRIKVEGNNFEENGWAIRLMANSMDNHFIKNNFIANSFDVSTNSINNFNTFENNYWSEYKGFDIDQDGIGDIPFRPVKLFSLVVEKNKPTLILIRSLFVDILDTAERIFPILTPETLLDNSPSMKKNIMIEINNLNKVYTNLHVLNNINLTIEKGKITYLVGPNGAGKTTLLKSILGLIKKYDGSIKIDGKLINGESNYRKIIGYMPQSASFPENLTVQNIFEMVKDLRSNKSFDEELIYEFKLKSELNKRLKNLSGGTMQKVNAALAFLFNPNILILDEPTAGLDPVSSSLLKDKILTENKKGKTILFTSHIISELEDLAQKIAFILEGKISFHGSLEELINMTGGKNLERSVAAIMIGKVA